ncbi:hypothetical protein M405DRAFT_809816, partial [Rhizopogon salebrosus TDB-379]
ASTETVSRSSTFVLCQTQRRQCVELHAISSREPDAHFLMWMMPPRRCKLAGFSHPILGREPDTHFLMCMTPLHRRELLPGFLTQYWAENQTTTFSCG